MLEIVLTIILAPIALVSVIVLAAAGVGFLKGFGKGFKKKTKSE